MLVAKNLMLLQLTTNYVCTALSSIYICICSSVQGHQPTEIKRDGVESFKFNKVGWLRREMA